MRQGRRKWSLEDEIFLALNYNKMSAKELGEKFNKTPNQIHAKVGHLKNKGLIGDAEQLAEREKRKKESKVNEFSEGLDLSKLTLNKKKRYKIYRKKNDKFEYEEYLIGRIIQETKELVTFKTKAGYCESFRKYDLLCGEYRVKEL
ncbi:hypothetical protein KQI41_01035 [Tissierella pigra]|uniref:hypothetical protein n=1 Tax=Tissierella pigra TaxID=2607614 RepID=UPI001C10E671|nr:hypothetical protein [Tissierella pigra]MBU5424979.1 hypothetical protein [Tissierella pigra]